MSTCSLHSPSHSAHRLIDVPRSPTPTLDEYLQFLSQLPELIDGRQADGVMAFSTLKSAVSTLNHSFTFHFEGWTLSGHATKRIDAMLTGHLKAGRATVDPAREKQWISAMLIRQMVMALFNDAFTNGTRSWDVTILKCLSLVFQAATCARAGDINQSSGYEAAVHLRWEHVTVKIMGTEEQPNMKMLIKLYYTKNNK